MKTRAIPSLALCALLACASGPALAERIARAYDLNNVTEVVVGGANHIELVQGDGDSLRAEGSAELMARVKVDQDGQRLTLSVRDTENKVFSLFSLFNDDKVTFYLQLKNLNSVEVKGASTGRIGNWRGKSLAVHAGGASDLDIGNLTLEQLRVELDGASNLTLTGLAAEQSSFHLSGASDAKVAGRSNLLKVNASGASDFKGKQLKATQAELEASGASDIDAEVTDQLKAQASGGSDIRYLGQPKLQSNASGASDITAIK